MRNAPSKTIDPEQDQRRCPRQRVSWLVSVAAGSRSFQGLTRDVSASGAKILLKERPALGAEVNLSFRPPGKRPVATRALVWRVDPDGLACMFVGTQEAEFLAAVAPRTVAPPPAAAAVAPAPAAPPVAPRPVAPSPVASRPVAPPQSAPPSRPITAPSPATPPAPAPSPAKTVATVLLVASDNGLRALAMAGLERGGYAVLDAGPQPLLALRMAEQHGSVITLALVAADLKLMNGELLAGRLAPLLPAAKLVLMSSRNSPRPSTPGALWLPTPCSDAEMLAAVRQALAG